MDTHARHGRWVLGGVLCAVAALAGARCFAAAETPADPAPAATSEHDAGWFGIVGAMNYHARLDESERMVNREMNGIFGRILPSWQEPITFKDWSENWKLWDLYFGVGKDLSPYWSWQATTGAGVGFISNGKRYHPLGIPLKIDIDFTRADVFVETGFNYYPWEKPTYKEAKSGASAVGSALRSTRPYLSLVGGYTWQNAVGDVGLSLPGAGRFARIKQEDTYNLFYIFPRVCIETPINARDSVNLTAGYLFFDSHSREFNSLAVGAFFKHKF